MVSNLFISKIKKFVESSPYLWYFANQIIKFLPFLLPHDQEYLGLKLLFDHKKKLQVIDIGANDGLSILSIMKIFPKAKINSFEPNGILIKSLKKICKVYKETIIHNVGLSNIRSEKLRFFMPKFNFINLHTATSVSKKKALDTVKFFYGKNIANKIKIIEFECPVDVLDNYKFKPNIIKIDVEGHETEVICGAIETIKKYRPVLLIEHAKERSKTIISKLKNLKYNFYYYSHKQKCFIKIKNDEDCEMPYRNFYGIPNKSYT